MKQFQVRLRSIQANNAGMVEIIVPKEDIYVYGENVSLVPMGGAEYLQIKDSKNIVIFICNASSVSFCKAIEKPAVVSTIGQRKEREDGKDE